MSTSVAENLDLLTEILLRLPVKPLLRFKCVCKQWLSLISDPRFCHSHTLFHHKTPHPFPSALLLAPLPLCGFPNWPIIPLNSNSDADLRVCNFDFLNVPHSTITILQSCNGLLLVKTREPLIVMHGCINHPSPRYFVCNPTTKHFVALVFPSLIYRPMTLQIYLAFNPLRSSHYKVILIRFKSWDERANKINVYSQETGSWSDLEVCFPNQKNMYMQGIYCNGALHWCTDAENSFYFDVEKECFKTFSLPSKNANQNYTYFGESGGYLHMIVGSFHSSTQLALDIFVLKDDYSGWSLRFHVPLSHMAVAFTDLNLDFRNVVQSIEVLSIFRKEKEEDSMVMFFIGGKVISYNLVYCTFRELGGFDPFLASLFNEDNEPVYVWFLNVKIFQYFESLSCVGASTACQQKSSDPHVSKLFKRRKRN